MPENQNVEVNPKPEVASKGAVTTVEMSFAPKSQEETQIEKITPAQSAETTSETKSEDPTSEISEDQLIKFLKSQGIEVSKIDEIKQKFSAQPQTAELTPEQKQRKELAAEKKRLDVYLANGGTFDQYMAIKSLANSDVAEISKAEALAELIQAGFSPEEAADMLKERYYQIELDGLQQDEDESDEDFDKRKQKLKKKIEFGAKKLASKSTYRQAQAKQVLSSLDEAIQNEILQEQEEKQFSSKVDEISSKIPRKMTLQLGKVDDLEIAPVEYDVAQSDIDSVKEIFKDPAKRNQFFYNNGKLKVEELFNVLLRNKALDSIAKRTYLEGQTSQVNFFRKRFPADNPRDLGVGGAPSKPDQKGQVVGKGKVTRV